jgi:asparagine synthase (glutamine-hydrolysing)
VWDPILRQLLAVADRAGLHRIFFNIQPRRLELDLEISSLGHARSPDFDQATISSYLCGVAPDPGRTLFASIRIVPPGCFVRFVPGEAHIVRYWSVPIPHRGLLTVADAAASWKPLFARVVEEHLPSSGPVGITLTSGLDSASVAAFGRPILPPAEWRALSWIAPELPTADEDAFQQRAALHLGIPYHPIRADLLWPLRDGPGPHVDRESLLGNPFVSIWRETFRRGRELGVTTLLTGISGDNLIGGNVEPLADLLLRGRWFRCAKEIRANRRVHGTPLSWLLRYPTFGVAARYFLPRRHERRPAWLGSKLPDAAPPSPSRHLLPAQMQRWRLLTDPRPAIAARQLGHIATTFGIELRHPWLDHRLVEWAAAVVPETATCGGFQKAPLRLALRGALPDEILDARDKIYPTAIAVRGLRERESQKVWTHLENMRAADLGFVEPEPLRSAYRRYLDGERSTAFWPAVILEAWLRRYFP